MYPAGLTPGDSDQPQGVSCAGVYSSASRDQVVELLATMGFSGWVGPAQERWVVVVAENPLGRVAAGKRTISDVTREVAAGTGTLALGAQVRRDESLGLWAFDGEREIAAIDTAPPGTDGFGAPGFGASGEVLLDEFGEPMADAFGEPVGAQMFADDDDEEFEHAALARALGQPEAAEELTDLIEDELSEDESESERLTALARLLDLPTWLVAATSLPKDIWGGPRREEFLRLQAGRTGAAGWIPGYLTRKVTRRPPRPPEPH